MHLRPGHGDCAGKPDCDSDCPRQQFHRFLESPLTEQDRQMHERIRQRRDALLRGEIPA